MAVRFTNITVDHMTRVICPGGQGAPDLNVLCGKAVVLRADGCLDEERVRHLLGGLDVKDRRRVLFAGDVCIAQDGAQALRNAGVWLAGFGIMPILKADADGCADGCADGYAEGNGERCAVGFGIGGMITTLLREGITVLEGADLREVLKEGENIAFYELHAVPFGEGSDGVFPAAAVLETCRKRYKMTTLCYIRKDDSYLMLYRNRKENDENEGKWIGIGGKIEEGESPEQCVRREVFEETGLILLEFSFRGIVTFVNDVWENEYMMLYEGTSFSGELRSECDEGELAWVPFDRIMDLPLWEGDRIFLKKLIAGEGDASCRLEYHSDHLVKAI